MQCLNEITSGNFQVASPQPEIYTACTYILVQPTELQSQIFNITAVEGLQLSGAIVAVWAIGFATRMGIKALNINEEEIKS